jgi:hypothetical protein
MIRTQETTTPATTQIDGMIQEQQAVLMLALAELIAIAQPVMSVKQN